MLKCSTEGKRYKYLQKQRCNFGRTDKASAACKRKYNHQIQAATYSK